MRTTPDIRLRQANDAPIRGDGDFVLYWMIANRRLGWNFALDRAVEHARVLGKPLLILEALRCGYRWASDRIHRFVLEGMADHQRRIVERRGEGVLYYPYVERAAGAGSGLLEALAARACVVVTDDFPCFFLPSMVAAAAPRLGVRLEVVDSNGLMPLAAVGKTHHRAYDFRRFLHKNLPDHLGDFPAEDPLAEVPGFRLDALPKALLERWPSATAQALTELDALLASLPIDHAVAPVASLPGGSPAAVQRMEGFLENRLVAYGEGRNHPDDDTASGLSPYLHFGHISAHQIFRALVAREGWNPGNLAATTKGQREGWWGMSVGAEAFLDELITWREVGYAFCHREPDYDRYEALPPWARQTLEEHATDQRPYLYSREEFEAATTHDEIWNAAQRQLRAEGRIHNYLRMLWGKKVLHWTAHPREALEILIELNNKYALDGRNPNSYSGIFWCLGRFDRAWGPEREVFGKVRYMTSRSTRSKLRLKHYLRRWGK
jgi:deoxyribodipyrimidine photo-lyase